MANIPKIGLALGSGAARGLAHIGVIKVLKENNIEIDYVAGTSVGAMVGAYYALNGDIQNFEEKVRKLTKKDVFSLVDLTTPTQSILKGNKVKKFLEDCYRENAFKDIKIPLTVVATDLYTGREFLINDGKLTDAVMASISIPGVFPPFEFNGRKLVDGGIVNSTPIDIVKNMGADVVIAVDLPISIPEKKSNLNMIEIILQSFEIMRSKLNNSKEDDKTIILTPKFKDTLSGHQFYNQEYIEEGERIAKEALPRIKKMINREISLR